MTSRTEVQPGEASSPAPVDRAELERHVKDMYTSVATKPDGEFHFEVGRGLAERLGYDPRILDQIPASAIESFAGVGHHFDIAALEPGQRVLDLGSGSGTDTFVAAVAVGSFGRVDGVEMTAAQRDKAEHLRSEAGFQEVHFHAGRIEDLPFEDETFDCVISNGVINLVADKQRVFDEAARVLKHQGRFALSDIVTQQQLPEGVVCDVALWASCIGGAMHREDYQRAIERSGMSVEQVKRNDYAFLSGRAERAAEKFGVESVSLLATKS